MSSKANAFAELMKQAKGQGVAETDKPDAGRTFKQKRKGKREHHDYGKIGVYIRTETIAEVKARLVRERKELSDLVQDLLDEWLANTPKRELGRNGAP
jgi:hypothetical protein